VNTVHDTQADWIAAWAMSSGLRKSP